MKILVTGSNGQLGSELQDLANQYLSFRFVFTNIDDLDLTDHEAVKDFIEAEDFDVIINCAAFTAVDKAESETELADTINHLAVKNLAEIAKARHIKLIHISTDYVFDGTKDTPYAETDAPNPQSAYGYTKLKGEQAMQRINPASSVIIRTSWLYSGYAQNFVKTMLRLGQEKKELNVVSDQIGSPTYAADLAQAILEIVPQLKNDQVETYHFANSGNCSWYELAKAIFEIKDMEVTVNPIITEQYPTAAKRPMYSVLASKNIRKTFKITISDWKEALSRCLQNM